MTSAARRIGQLLGAWALYALLAAAVFAPVAAEQAIAGVGFRDRLGTLPVEVSLSHNGVSTFDTGILGRLYWQMTGTGGLGATIRATGPPEAGGTLASYTSPEFVRTNAQFISDPGEVAQAYGEKLRSELLHDFLWVELWFGLLGGALLTLVFRAQSPIPVTVGSRNRRIGVGALALGLALAASTATAAYLFGNWEGNAEVDRAFPMPGVSQLSFSDSETLEVARQVQPFIEKNAQRIERQANSYAGAAEASLRSALDVQAAGLQARDGERIVIAEADPQGSLVGTRVRTTMYPILEEYLGEDTVALRTISGDISSNGTVAEAGFVAGEAEASPGIPLVVVKGDHDTETTVQQLKDAGVRVPDFDTTEVDGLRVVAANDPAFKTLFGGMIVNETGISETALGSSLREDTDPDQPKIVLFHQPRSAAGYIGIDDIGSLEAGVGRETTPWDDGIPDLPPGSINIGHLHDEEPPRVVWNTDGDEVTWTVVSQLGTSGGVEETPTFNRFSTPFSVPLKAITVQLQYVSTESGLQTGYASIEVATDGTVSIADRVDLGLPGGLPVSAADLTGE